MLALAAVWAYTSAAATGADPAPHSVFLLLCAVAFAWARIFSRFNSWIVPLVVVIGAAGIAGVHFESLLNAPLGNPFGYSNAVGSFYMLAAGAALMVAVRTRNAPLRAGAALLGVAFAAVPWLNGTATAATLVLLLPLALAACVYRIATARQLISTGGVLVLMVFVTTVVLGGLYDSTDRSGAINEAVDASLSERRPELWHDAISILADQPVFGAGPGRFAQESPTARADRDASWAHNEVLQFGAETGLLGLILAAAVLIWAHARLWSVPGDAGTVVAGMTISAVAVHACVDYVLHFPWIGIAAAALLGAGATVLPGRHSQGTRRVRRRARRQAGRHRSELQYPAGVFRGG